jgi:hypothetical protein
LEKDGARREGVRSMRKIVERERERECGIKGKT